MFVIKHKEGSYALRPEGTASIVRAYIENNLDKAAGFRKVYYTGAMFRRERPQKGRLRQFHHIGAEAIGSACAELDIEMIRLADHLLKEIALGGYLIKLNSLGCKKDKKELTAGLHKSLKGKLPKLCPDCKARFTRNPLRILDCKNEACRQIIGKLEIKDTHLCPDCREHFSKVTAGLDALGLNYEVSPHLVRGLDYYTRTVFEITHPDLGAQDALGAGGRYDNLVKELGGPDVGAIGFALGVERVLLAAGGRASTSSQNLVYLITLGEEAKKQGLKILDDLRSAGLPCDTDYENKSLKGAMRTANDLSARFVLILGENELKNNSVTLKDMASSEQREVPLEKIIAELKC
jgi:histidyl-tRNA synthetase